MKLFVALAFILSGAVYGAETAVILDNPSGGDVRFVFTDPLMNTAADKYFTTTTCMMRFQSANSVRENIVTLPCKAEVVKFVLNNGYKNIDRNVYAK